MKNRERIADLEAEVEALASDLWVERRHTSELEARIAELEKEN